MKQIKTFVVIVGLVSITGFIGWYQGDLAFADEKPVPPEINPAGDIPDSQVFVNYTSGQGGYDIEVPEGWARTTQGGNVIFIDKLDGLSVTITKAAHPPGVQSLRNNQAELLKKKGRAVRVKIINKIRLSSGPALVMVYESNSKPDPVVNKKVRLENSSYFYYKNGKLAELRLWAPLGADNVDQWNRVSNSFRWR